MARELLVKAEEAPPVLEHVPMSRERFAEILRASMVDVDPEALRRRGRVFYRNEWGLSAADVPSAWCDLCGADEVPTSLEIMIDWPGTFTSVYLQNVCLACWNVGASLLTGDTGVATGTVAS